MVVSNLNHFYRGHGWPVRRTTGQQRLGIYRHKNQPSPAVEVQGELPQPVAQERVRAPGQDIAQTARGVQIGQAGAQLGSTLRSKLSLCLAVITADLLQFGVRELDFHLNLAPNIITDLVI